MSQNATTDFPYFFEGAEKRLEVIFRTNPNTPARGLLTVSHDQWTRMLDKVNCQVLAVSSNQHQTAFVLSESSFFLTATKVMLKTCGNTTLLECLPLLMKYSERLFMNVDAVSYSHKNFQLPNRQLDGYKNFETEIEVLNKYFDGKPYILEPSDPEDMSDRWFIYQAFPKSQTKWTGSDQKIEIIMTELDRKAMSYYYKADKTTSEVTTSSGIADIIPGMKIDGHLFDPCGYSMNGIGTVNPEIYSTIHITPEAGFSYVSYECNLKQANYDSIIKKVLSIFKPAKFMVVVYAEKDAVCKIDHPFTAQIPGFQRDGYSKVLYSNTARAVSCSRYSCNH